MSGGLCLTIQWSPKDSSQCFPFTISVSPHVKNCSSASGLFWMIKISVLLTCIFFCWHCSQSASGAMRSVYPISFLNGCPSKRIWRYRWRISGLLMIRLVHPMCQGRKLPIRFYLSRQLLFRKQIFYPHRESTLSRFSRPANKTGIWRRQARSTLCCLHCYRHGQYHSCRSSAPGRHNNHNH